MIIVASVVIITAVLLPYSQMYCTWFWQAWKKITKEKNQKKFQKPNFKSLHMYCKAQLMNRNSQSFWSYCQMRLNHYVTDLLTAHNFVEISLPKK
jgi:hypothetical protein